MFTLTGRSGWRGASVPKRFAAVDFDSRRLHIVCAERTGKGVRIRQLTHAEMPEDLDTTDARAVGKFLGRTLKKMRPSVKAVVMSVPRGLAVLKPLQFPPGTAYEDLAGMVQFQVEKELPFPMAEAVVDFTVASHYDAEVADDRPHVNVLVSAVRLPVVEHYKQITLTAGVALIRLGLRPVATIRCVTECLGEAAPGPLAVIHVTADETEIMVLCGGALAFSRSALFAEPLPREVPETDVPRHARTVAAEIARSIQTYQAAEGGGTVERILLAGGTGIEAGVARLLRGRLGVSCERFSPAGPLKLPDDGMASAFIAPLGMVVGQDGSATPFDFLNPKRPRVRRNIKKIRRGLAAAAVAVVLAAGIAAGSMWIGGKRAVVADLKRQAAELKKQRKPYDTQAESLKTLRDWDSRGVDLTGHWTYISSVAPSCKDLYITSLKVGVDGSLRLNVRAKDDTAIIEFGRTLRSDRAGYTIKTNRVATGEDPFLYLYGTTLSITPPKGKPVDLTDLTPRERPKDDMSGDRVSDRDKYRSDRGRRR